MPTTTSSTMPPRTKRRKLTSQKPSFYQSSASAGSPSTAVVSNLTKLFESYRDPANDDQTTVSVNGTMKYMQDLGVDLEEPMVLVVSEVVQSPTMGELGKTGFVDGWKGLGCDSISKQKNWILQTRQSLPNDLDLFKRVYKHTFLIGRTAGQKAVTLEAALEYWRLLFSISSPEKAGQATPWRWNTSATPWLDYWVEFLEKNWKKTVNRDMWNMLLQFWEKSLTDPTMSWWDENSAWPSVIDDFVSFVKDKREGKMDIE